MDAEVLAGIAEKTRHARQERLAITPPTARAGRRGPCWKRPAPCLQGWKRDAEQLMNPKSVWEAVCVHLIAVLAHFNWLAPGLEAPMPVPS